MRPGVPPLSAGTPNGIGGDRSTTSSPLAKPKTMPLATSGGSACFMSREIHAGSRKNRPVAGFLAILNAATAPLNTSPCSIGALNFGCFGPQNGTSTQRVPFASS